MSEKLLFVLSLLVFFSREACLGEEFSFQGFGDAHSNIYLNGDAEIKHSGILELTGDSTRLVGHAFYNTPIRFKNSSHGEEGVVASFSTSFAFAIVPEYDKLGGHGFAFTVSKSKEMLGAFPSQYLGLMNSDDLGNSSNHVFAVEFDTVQDFEFGDISDNHVGIDLNSLVSNASINATYFDTNNSRKEEVSLKSGRMIQAWIDYNSSRQQVDVTLSLSSSKPSVSILTFPVDLSLVFLDFMYVGFSASTGLLASSHYISGWSFTTKGEANSLDLSLLPSIPGPKQNLQLPLILGTSLSVAALLVLTVVTIFCIVKKLMNRDVIESWEHEIGPHRFSFKELKNATKGFRDKDLLGFGGFGRVYKGTLPNSNTQVAVKRINRESRQGLREFVSEIESIGRLRHRNLVFLQGWCRRRDDLMLVYDFMPNGSLDKHLFDEPKAVLSWDRRFNIVKGVASGLLYLHEEWEQTVVHRDIKAGNVLLDAEMNGRLSDFGLAKLYEHGQNPSTTKVVGTLGYLAPELTKTGKPTTSSDVFAFGALLLEVVCGRRPVEAKALPEELFLVDLVWDKWKQGSVLEVVDPRLGGQYNEAEVVLVIKLGLMCSNNAPAKRPTMRQVMGYLEGEVAVPEALKLEAPNESGSKKPDDGVRRRLEDLTSSSYSEKVSSWSTAYEGDGDTDVETGLVSPF